MKKILLAALIFLDGLLMISAGFFLYVHITKPSGGPGMILSKTSAALPVTNQLLNSAPVPVRPGSLITVSSGTPAGMANSQPLVEGGMRKILFSYRNPKARQAFIRADFTGWKADAMHRDPKGTWVYQANLLPGEYAYCYTVDDKTFRDPANKRTKQIGHTFVSAIVVKPISPPPQ